MAEPDKEKLRAFTIIAVVIASVFWIVHAFFLGDPLFGFVVFAVVVMCFLYLHQRAPELDEGVPAYRYRGVLAGASVVSLVSIFITFWAWWPKEESHKLGVLLLLPVVLPYAFIPLRLYGKRLRKGLTLAMSMGGALFVPGFYLIRFAITWDNRWWVLCSLIVAILMQLLLFVVALAAYIGLPRSPRPGLRDLAGPAYGFCLFAGFLCFYSPMPYYIADNEHSAREALENKALYLFEEARTHGGLYPGAVGLGPDSNRACTAELEPQNGYVFEYSGTPPSSPFQGCTLFEGFTITARPAIFGKTGIRSYYISNKNLRHLPDIHFTSENRPATATDPWIYRKIPTGRIAIGFLLLGVLATYLIFGKTSGAVIIYRIPPFLTCAVPLLYMGLSLAFRPLFTKVIGHHIHARWQETIQVLVLIGIVWALINAAVDRQRKANLLGLAIPMGIVVLIVFLSVFHALDPSRFES